MECYEPVGTSYFQQDEEFQTMTYSPERKPWYWTVTPQGPPDYWKGCESVMVKFSSGNIISSFVQHHVHPHIHIRLPSYSYTSVHKQ